MWKVKKIRQDFGDLCCVTRREGGEISSPFGYIFPTPLPINMTSIISLKSTGENGFGEELGGGGGGHASSCFGNEDRGVLIAAAGDSIWDNRGACGRSYTVSCTGGTNDVPNPCRGGSVTVTIVDYCPGCASRGVTMDLSQEAFAMIANPDAGRIQIDYN
ncbi:hypothetical protein ZIOFF_058775 [Zingiber officinale]|uniref:Expansin-like EG45 domain-containing protein n=1 Tax=Zingiber officinale TaxID=94328 RepID=A0A8J5F8F4_ZINOF|nr:hypothetical protein ZIOFF_058775 [Zingiber officinale]